ncbi:hypothetical protein CPB84DRAFT_1847369 [Gymnopilus junonius]|uniref:Uncharacterized protein n=1 Tax=Gymnopilus junonius TaxID=109634 RepID=A0A9P5NNC6_GYMJU|nr:hypothetical protein CPB84DRAFT_1847369 [Gymnopilus junonius]
MGIAAITALLDFIYIAQYKTHNMETLGYLQGALDRFHTHKDYFRQTGIREDFNIPKFHSLTHYIESIKLFGTTDNYNTETFEQEKIAGFEAYQKEILTSGTEVANEGGTQREALPITLAKQPNFLGRSIATIHEKHDAPDFEYYLKQYLNCFMDKPVGQRHLDQIPLSFMKEKDIVKAVSKSAKHPHGCFDMVIVPIKESAESTGLEGTRVGQIKVIFTLPKRLDTVLGPRDLPSNWPQGPLAYVNGILPLLMQPKRDME